jgi:hypothetical protein
MKVKKTNVKSLFRYCGVLAAHFIMFSNEAVAQKNPEADRQTMDVKFLMEQDGFLVFRTVINSSSEKRTVLKLTNATDELLYSEIIQKPDYSKIFKFPMHEDGQIHFQLLSGKETIRKSFSIDAITKQTYVVEETY